jgi:hypothetical protein
MLLIGCALPKSPPEIVAGEFVGPQTQLVQRDGVHALRVECPSPGWKVKLDEVRRAWDRSDAYMTIERPSPLFVYPQVVTIQEVLTGVPERSSVRVLGRVVDSGNARGGYRTMLSESGASP